MDEIVPSGFRRLVRQIPPVSSAGLSTVPVGIGLGEGRARLQAPGRAGSRLQAPGRQALGYCGGLRLAGSDLRAPGPRRERLGVGAPRATTGLGLRGRDGAGSVLGIHGPQRPPPGVSGAPRSEALRGASGASRGGSGASTWVHAPATGQLCGMASRELLARSWGRSGREARDCSGLAPERLDRLRARLNAPELASVKARAGAGRARPPEEARFYPLARPLRPAARVVPAARAARAARAAPSSSANVRASSSRSSRRAFS